MLQLRCFFGALYGGVYLPRCIVSLDGAVQKCSALFDFLNVGSYWNVDFSCANLLRVHYSYGKERDAFQAKYPPISTKLKAYPTICVLRRR